MPVKSPPKHRHDGTSPLPLGMDWSPPPRKWDGRDTMWPHDPRTGWSYCVMIPSWATRSEQKISDGSLADPIVFYRVLVGVQSPEGMSVTRGLFRRFSDFLKLFNVLKRLFPRKNLPQAPPKHRFLRINSSQTLLEERRCALVDWMGKLLSDIEISRSAPVASFLELEAAARSSFNEGDQKIINTPGGQNGSSSSDASIFAGSSSATSKPLSVASDYGSDNAYEASDLGTPRMGTEHNSEIGSEDLSADQDLTATVCMSVKYGTPDDEYRLFAGESILEQVDAFPGNKMESAKEKSVLQRESLRGNTSMELLSELEGDKGGGHARKMSADSVGSDISSVRGSEMSNAGFANFSSHLMDLSRHSEAAGLHILNSVQVVLPLDQRNKMNRVLTTMQRRLATARTDMEDLIARLNQEIAVKEYLTTKVKDLDVELETTKQRSKESLQQAILVERERVTQMQWDMEEFRRKSSEMESMLKLEQDERVRAESAKRSAISERESLLQELDMTREQLENLQRRQEDLESKSKADIKVLVKEVKSLRKIQNELKQELTQTMKEKTELERVLQKENQRKERAKLSRTKLLHECKILRGRLQECSVNSLSEEEDKFTVDVSSLSDAMDLLTTSDNRIGLLLAEAQLLAQDDESAVASVGRNGGNKFHGNNIADGGEDQQVTEEDVRKMLTDIFIDNARLRQQVNSVTRCALNSFIKPDREESPAADDTAHLRKTVLNKFLER